MTVVERKGFCGGRGDALALALVLAKPTRVPAIECYSTAAVPNGTRQVSVGACAPLWEVGWMDGWRAGRRTAAWFLGGDAMVQL